MKSIQKIVESVLRTDFKARENDVYLIRIVLDRLGLPTDIKQMPLDIGNIFESIRRARCKVQAEQPELRASKRVQLARAEKEIKVREFLFD